MESQGVWTLMREQGVTKTSIVFIAMISMTFFAAFILPSVFGYFASICLAETPYLPCKNVSDFFPMFFGAIVAVSEIFSFKYFIQLPMWKIAATAITFLLASVFGVMILKKNYEQSIKTS